MDLLIIFSLYMCLLFMFMVWYSFIVEYDWDIWYWYLYMVWLSGIMLVLLCIMEGLLGYSELLSYWGYMVLCGLCSILGYYNMD